MAQTTYTYSIAADMPGGAVNPSNLQSEIQNSDITISLDGINTSGDVLDIVFNDALPAADKTLLDGDATGPAGGLLAAHDNGPTVDIQLVDLSTPHGPDGAPVVQSRVNQLGYYLCDRDVKLKTAVVDEASAIEDLRVDPSTNLRAGWGEATLVGVYKDDAGSMVQCADQADADLNAILTVVTYQAKTSGTPIKYELRGGALYADPATSGWENQVYAIAAPQIPLDSGGQIPFFDGYLAPYAGDWMQSINPAASEMDPEATPLASELCVWVYYPAGVKLEHVLRFVTYRPPGS